MIRLKPSAGWSPTSTATRTGSGSPGGGVTGTRTRWATRAGWPGTAQSQVTRHEPPVEAASVGTGGVGVASVAVAAGGLFAPFDGRFIEGVDAVDVQAAASSTTRPASSGTR
ncbi:hypothetical protein [Micromonospora sp. M42]|uniref:hypothetical protein n=1 Tax=Micromonospora sp. M42 TaxID=457406 RepID=UPI0018DB6664|nr:hypothetical protein [Micromonospora sp. M42]